MKTKIQECPFCAKAPSGKKFCSTDRGPSLICDNCGTDGPPPLPEGETYVYSASTERRLQAASIRLWNHRIQNQEFFIFTTKELGVLVRSLLRAMDKTPDREMAVHKALYERLSGELISRLPKKTLRRVAKAMDRVSGR